MAPNTQPFKKPHLTDIQLGWVCGFLEGEGSFGAYQTNKNSSKKYQRIQAGSTDRENLVRLKTLLGGTICEMKPREGRENNKTMYLWAISAHEQAKGTMKLLREHMTPRRQLQIDKALAGS